MITSSPIRADSAHYRYWAFLSYSHQDNVAERKNGERDCFRWADWVHRELETFRVPKAFLSQPCAIGEPMPARFYPVFQDEKELSAAPDLDDSIKEALKFSRHLVVIASPRSARSPYVDSEVEYFRSLGRSDRIFTLIIDGEPDTEGGASPEECFCHSLRGGPKNARPGIGQPIAGDLRIKLGARTREIHRQDIRANKHILEIGKLKLIAGLMDVGIDELVQRDKTRHASAMRLRVLVFAAIAALLAGVATTAFVQKRKAENSESRAIASRKRAEGLVTFMQHALHQKLKAVGRLDLMLDVDQAIEAYHESILTEQSTPESLREWSGALVQQGDSAKERGDLIEAMNLYGKGNTIITELLRADPDNSQWLHDANVCRFRIADLLREQGHLADAAEAYAIIEDVCHKLLEGNPDSVRDLKCLDVCLTRKGDILMAQQRPLLALDAYLKSMAITTRLQERNPWDVETHYALCIGQKEVGRALLAAGRLKEARQAFERMTVLARTLNSFDDKSATYKALLSESHGRIGDVYRVDDDLLRALAAYEKSCAIMSALVQSDAANAAWKHSLASSLNKKAEILFNLERTDDAYRTCRESLTILDRLVAIHAANVEWRQNLAITYNQCGRILLAQGKLNEAIAQFLEAMEIRKKLVELNESDVERRWDLSTSYDLIGVVYLRDGNSESATEFCQMGLEIAKDLASRHPDVVEWRYGVAVGYDHLAEIFQSLGKVQEALDLYREAMKVLEELVQADSSGRWVTGLALFCLRVGDAEKKLGLEYESQTRRGIQLLQEVASRRELNPRQTKILASLNELLPESAKAGR